VIQAGRFKTGGEMNVGGVTPEALQSSRDATVEGRRPGWGMLYAILLASVALVWIGSHFEAIMGRPALLQSAVVLTILGLLFTWTRLHRSFLLAQSDATPPVPAHPFTILRVPFSRTPDATRRRQAPEAQPAAHSPLR